MILQVGVKIFLKNPEGKYLLLKRSPLKYPDIINTWDIVGGRIEPGVGLLENLRREIFEETKLEYKGIPRFVAAQDILRVGKHVVRLTYAGEIAGQPVLDNDHTEFCWLALDEIEKLKGVDEFAKALIPILTTEERAK